MSTRRISLGDAELQVEVEGVGPPLLLIHGFPLRHEMWRHQLTELAAVAQVIAPDLRGFGQSSPASDTLTMSQMADDLARLLDELGIRGPIAVAGHSMGGYVLWEFWRRHRQWVGRLILCNSRAAPDTPEAAENRCRLADRALAEGRQPVIDAFLPKLLGDTARRDQPQLVSELQAMMESAPPASLAAGLRAMAERADARPWLKELGVPALFLTGDEDGISTPGENRSMHEVTPGSRVVVVAGAGHMAPWEAPDRVNAAIAAFLRG